MNFTTVYLSCTITTNTFDDRHKKSVIVYRIVRRFYVHRIWRIVCRKNEEGFVWGEDFLKNPTAFIIISISVSMGFWIWIQRNRQVRKPRKFRKTWRTSSYLCSISRKPFGCQETTGNRNHVNYWIETTSILLTRPILVAISWGFPGRVSKF